MLTQNRDLNAARLDGDQLYASGELVAAQAVFQELVAASHALNWSLFQLGRIANQLGRWMDAIEHFDAALTCADPIVWAHLEKALALEQLGADPKAVASELAQFVRHPPEGLADGHYAIIHAGAHRAFEAKAFGDAQVLYDFLMERGQGGYLCKLRWADLRILTGEPLAALRMLDQLTADPEYDFWGEVTRARALIQLERYDVAATVVQSLLPRAPDNPDLVRMLFIALEGSGDHEQLASAEEFLKCLSADQQFEILLRTRLNREDYDGVARLFDDYPGVLTPANARLAAKAVRELRRKGDFATMERLAAKIGSQVEATTGLPLRRAAIVCWDLAHNPVGRAAVLHKLLSQSCSVELVGPMWRRFGRDLWRPLRGEPLHIRSFQPSDLLDVWREGATIALANQYDVVIVCKPRLPGLIVGLLLAEQSGCPLLVDIDENELAFSAGAAGGGCVERELIDEPFGALGTQLASEYLTVADAITLSNPALQKQFPGHIVRHARDEDVRLVDREAARRSFGLSGDDFVIAFIGTARSHKGISHILSALQAIGDRRAKLLLAGAVAPDIEQQILKAGLEGQIIRYDMFGVSELGRFLAAADLVPVLQDADSPISQTQMPAKITDALQYGVPIVATDVPPLRDMAMRGVVDVIAVSDFGDYLRTAMAQPQSLKSRDHRRRVFAEEFSLAVNRSRLAAAIREANERHDGSQSKITAALRDLVARTRAALAAKEARNTAANARPALAAPRRDVVFFWKQNDSGLFGRRSDMVVKYLLKSDRIGRLIHFDQSAGMADLRHMATDKSRGRRSAAAMQSDQTLDRLLELSDEPRLKRRLFLLRQPGGGRGIAGRPAADADQLAEFVRTSLHAEGLDPERAIAWVCPVFRGFAEVATKLSFGGVVVDLIDDQRAWLVSDDERMRLRAEYAATLDIADVVLTNCEGNRQRFAWGHPDIVVIPNGAEIEPSAAPTAMPEPLRQLRRPVVGYVGNLNDRVDWQLVHDIAALRPSWSIVMVGPVSEDRLPEWVANCPNLFLPGPVAYEQSRSWIGSFDVAIMPHLRSAMTEAMNPLKLYNYLAAGVPVVTTPVANIDEVADLVSIRYTTDEFIEAIESLLSSPRRQVPPERLQSFSWERRVNTMLDEIDRLL